MSRLYWTPNKVYNSEIDIVVVIISKQVLEEEEVWVRIQLNVIHILN